MISSVEGRWRQMVLGKSSYTYIAGVDDFVQALIHTCASEVQFLCYCLFSIIGAVECRDWLNNGWSNRTNNVKMRCLKGTESRAHIDAERQSGRAPCFEARRNETPAWNCLLHPSYASRQVLHNMLPSTSGGTHLQQPFSQLQLPISL